MNILVTGASGFLGFHIAKLLKEQGHNVFNFSRSHSLELDEINVETRQGNLNNPDQIQEALNDIDAVFHVASKVGMWGIWKDYLDINIEGTKSLVKCMLDKNIKYLIYTSTPSVVFGKDDLKGVNENQAYPKKFLNHYSKSKAIAEKFVLDQNMENFKTVSIRPHLIYGERDKNLIPRLVDATRSGRLKIIGDGKNQVDIIYVENAAKAHLDVFKELLKPESKCGGKAYFIGQDEPVYLWDFLNTILKYHHISEISTMISLKSAYFIGALLEIFYKLFKVFDKEPAMTRFVALNLAKSHYFSHQNAIDDFNFVNDISTKQSLQRLQDHIESGANHE